MKRISTHSFNPKNREPRAGTHGGSLFYGVLLRLTAYRSLSSHLLMRSETTFAITETKKEIKVLMLQPSLPKKSGLVTGKSIIAYLSFFQSSPRKDFLKNA